MNPGSAPSTHLRTALWLTKYFFSIVLFGLTTRPHIYRCRYGPSELVHSFTLMHRSRVLSGGGRQVVLGWNPSSNRPMGKFL